MLLDGWRLLHRRCQFRQKVIAALRRARGYQSDLNLALLSPVPDAIKLLNLHRADHPVHLNGFLRLFANVAAVLGKGEVFWRFEQLHATHRAAAFLHVEVAGDILWNRNS